MNVIVRNFERNNFKIQGKKDYFTLIYYLQIIQRDTEEEVKGISQ